MNSERVRRGVAAWHAVMTAHAVLRDRFDTKLHEVGAPPLAWLEVLTVLHDAPDAKLRMQELADHMVLSKSGVTRLVDRMEERGLVARRASSGDRRGIDVGATAAGRRLFREAEPHLLAAIDEYLGKHLSDREMGQLETILSSVLVANGRYPHDPALGGQKDG